MGKEGMVKGVRERGVAFVRALKLSKCEWFVCVGVCDYVFMYVRGSVRVRVAAVQESGKLECNSVPHPGKQTLDNDACRRDLVVQSSSFFIWQVLMLCSAACSRTARTCADGARGVLLRRSAAST
jgi:hypothetical protein